MRRLQFNAGLGRLRVEDRPKAMALGREHKIEAA